MKPAILQLGAVQVRQRGRAQYFSPSTLQGGSPGKGALARSSLQVGSGFRTGPQPGLGWIANATVLFRFLKYTILKGRAKDKASEELFCTRKSSSQWANPAFSAGPSSFDGPGVFCVLSLYPFAMCLWAHGLHPLTSISCTFQVRGYRSVPDLDCFPRGSVLQKATCRAAVRKGNFQGWKSPALGTWACLSGCHS